MQIKYIKL